jgi:hypothetical protein
VSKIDIMADRVVLLTDAEENKPNSKSSQNIKNWTASPFDNKING